MATETQSIEDEANVILFTQEEAILIQRLAEELTKAVSGMDEVTAQVQILNLKMDEINWRLSEPIQRPC